jgi:hypothetical protein
MTHQEIREEIAEWEKFKDKAWALLMEDEDGYRSAYLESVKQAVMQIESLNKMLDLA